MATLLALDPVLARSFGAAISIVLVVGAWQKLRDLEGFRFAVERYRLVPAPLARGVAWLLPPLEGAAGLALLFGATRTVGSVLALAVLAVVSAAVAINVLRGRTDLDCGCGGSSGQPRIGWGLVARNAALALAVLLAGSEGAARPFGWIDALSLIGGSLALLGLYLAANQLLANQPRLLGLRAPPGRRLASSAPRGGESTRERPFVDSRRNRA